MSSYRRYLINTIINRLHPDEIWYYSIDKNIVTPYSSSGFNANILSNTYTNRGKLKFDNNLTTVGSNGFKNCTTLYIVEIPEFVNSIGEYAFSGCTSLRDFLPISDNITVIGNYAFQNCSNLSNLTLDYDNLTSIGLLSFYNTNIKYFEVKSGVTTLGAQAFTLAGNSNSTIKLEKNIGSYSTATNSPFYNNNFENIIVESGVTSIGQSAFFNQSNSKYLKKLVLPDTLTTLGNYAFYSYDSLENDLTIYNGITSMGIQTFKGCGNNSKYVKLNIDSNTSNWSDSTYGSFYQHKFSEINFGEHVTIIGNYNFNAGTVLKKITFPEGLLTIGTQAFCNTSSINSDLTIPSTVTSINAQAFYCCGDGTGKLYIKCKVPDYSSASNSAFYHVGFYELTLSDNCTSIGDYAFDGNTYIQKVNIQTNITSVGYRAFAYVPHIGDFTLPASLTTIDNAAFYQFGKSGNTGTLYVNCNIPNSSDDAEILYKVNFAKIIIGSGVTKIGNRAFINNTNITGSISIPSSVTSIGDYAFYGLENVKNLTLNPTSCTFGILAFYKFGDGTGNLVINCNIPNSSADAEIFASAKFKKVTLDSGCTSVGNRSFINHTYINDLSLPSTLTSIGEYAFYGCSNLDCDVTIPYGATLGTLAFSSNAGGSNARLFINCNIANQGAGNTCPFYQCTFSEIHIGEGVTTIGNFGICTQKSSTTVLTLPSTLTTIGNYAFYGMSGVGNNITIPSSVTSIGQYAFQNFGNGSGTLTINCNVPSFNNGLAYGAFYTTNVNSVVIGEGVTSVGYCGLGGNSKIKGLSLPSTLTTIGAYAFYGESSVTSDIIIPAGVKSIGNYAFQSFGTGDGILTVKCNIPDFNNGIQYGAFYTTNVKELIVDEGVTTIGYSGFGSNSKIKKITLPSTITSLGNYAFYGTSGVTDFKIYATIPPTISQYTFNNTSYNIQVPSESVEAYKTSWSGLSSRIITISE